jgi:hypothetical protein
MAVTLKAINEELARRGHHALLAKGDGYFYFWSGEAADWLDRTVTVPKLSSLTVDQWVEEFRKLKTKNQEILRGGKRAGKGDVGRSKMD